MSGEIPPRPTPPRRVAETAHAWLAWFGVTRLVVSALSVGVVVAGVVWLVRPPAPQTESSLPFANTSVPAATLAPPPTAPATSAPVTAPSELHVHVAGAVLAPGVYELLAGDRVHMAIEAAGGPSPVADLNGLNLAAAVGDGQRIYVPESGEVDPAQVPSGGTPGSLGSPTTGGVDVASGPLDINTATAAQLDTLPGIGPSTAAGIVQDRERHGPFATVEDLERVPGIGPAKLGAVADLVTV